jgi:hypothetical protein
MLFILITPSFSGPCIFAERVNTIECLEGFEGVAQSSRDWQSRCLQGDNVQKLTLSKSLSIAPC